jgi:hypothetical protein
MQIMRKGVLIMHVLYKCIAHRRTRRGGGRVDEHRTFFGIN